MLKLIPTPTKTQGLELLLASSGEGVFTGGGPLAGVEECGSSYRVIGVSHDGQEVTKPLYK